MLCGRMCICMVTLMMMFTHMTTIISMPAKTIRLRKMPCYRQRPSTIRMLSIWLRRVIR